jgi:hypothetical protein
MQPVSVSLPQVSPAQKASAARPKIPFIDLVSVTARYCLLYTRHIHLKRNFNGTPKLQYYGDIAP